MWTRCEVAAQLLALGDEPLHQDIGARGRAQTCGAHGLPDFQFSRAEIDGDMLRAPATGPRHQRTPSSCAGQ